MPAIVVLGAGVIGLTCALELSKRKENTVTVVAKFMPGDYDIEYTSPFAGANVLPMALEATSRWERRTWPELQRLAASVPEAGIHFQKARVFRRKQEADAGFKGALSDGLFVPDPWYKSLMPDYRELRADELPANHAFVSGCEFGSVCINTATYLQWLVGQCAARGVVFRRGVLAHVADAAGMSHTGKKADVVVNACGLQACKLGA